MRNPKSCEYISCIYGNFIHTADTLEPVLFVVVIQLTIICMEFDVRECTVTICSTMSGADSVISIYSYIYMWMDSCIY